MAAFPPRLYQEAAAAVGELKRVTSEPDINLEVAIALEIGDWEALAKPLATFAEEASKFDAATLMQAASTRNQS